MAGAAHLAGLERWPGMPTSGRFVLKTGNGWFWQCDLCGDYMAGKPVDTMQAAFTLALAHSEECVGYYSEGAS